MSRETSQAESLAVGGFLTPFLEIFVGKGSVTDHLVRKLAHLTEYAALGAVMAYLLELCGKKTFFHISYTFFCGMAAAVIDESIQLIAAGRGAQVQDVLLDCCGIAIGIGIVMIVLGLAKKLRQSKR